MKHTISYKYSLYLCAVLCFVACSEENFVGEAIHQQVVLELQTSAVATRTALLEDGKTVVWNEDDELAVYDYEASKHRFTAVLTDGSGARFSGKITAQKSDFLALYPYALGGEVLTAAGTITATLPEVQTAAKNTFSPGLNISVAKGERNVDGSPSVVTFYNVCQLLQFSVPANAAGKIEQIVFEASTPVSGTLDIDYSADVPAVSIPTDASKRITINPPAGATTFDEGTYYIVTAPVETKGFAMTFTCSGSTYTLSSNSTFGGTAGKVYSLGCIDLVSTPQVTAKHQYADGLLQGTLLVVSNPPIDGGEWKAVIRNSDGVAVRTMQGVGTLSSSEEDANWPYLLRGNYALEYTFATSNGKEMTKTLPFNIDEVPELSVTVSAHTSYSYYKGDGVAYSIDNANLCEPYKVYAPVIKVNGVAPKLFSNANYSFLIGNNFNGSLSNSKDGVYTYNDYTVNAYNVYTLTGRVTFDGVVRTGEKTVYITGLPYTAEPPTSTDWTGSATFNSDHVLLREKTITKSFYCPENINVNVQHSVTVSKNSWEVTSAKYSLLCSGVSLVEVAPKSGVTQTDGQTKQGTLTGSNPTVSCIHEGGWYSGTNAKVYKIRVQYR